MFQQLQEMTPIVYGHLFSVQNSDMQILIQATTEVHVTAVPNIRDEELETLKENNRRLKNQVINLQGNVKTKKNKLKKLKWAGKS